MADSAIFDLTQETAMTAAHRLVVQDTSAATASQSATFALMGGLEWDTYGTPNQNNAAVVGKMIGWDISTLSADRNWTLPNDAQVGERCGVFITVGDDAYEVDILTDATGSEINGANHGVTSWSRLFISNECLILRCIKAGGAGDTDWIVEYDGRIPTKTAAYVNGNTDGTNSASTFIKPTDDGGTWTSLHDTGNTFSTSTGVITVRRDSKYLVTVQGFTPTTTGTRFDLQIKINSDSFVFLASTFDTSSNQFSSAFLSRCIDLSDGDTLTYETRYNLANHVLTGTRVSSFSVVEVF